MNARSTRPFGVADAMILVAATAVGFSILPTNWWGYLHPSGLRGWRAVAAALPFGLRCLVGPWLAWTIAGGIIRLRSPRPPIRRLRNQPGIVAFGAAGITFVVAIPSYVITHLRWPGPAQPWLVHPWLADSVGGLLHSVPLAVIAGWFTLWLGGRWRPEASWIDRLGRFFGSGWIVFHVIDAYWFETEWF